MNRIDKVQQLMKDKDIDACIYANGSNFQYITNCNDLKWNRMCFNNISGFFSSVNYPDYIIIIKKNDYIILTSRDYQDYFKDFNYKVIFFEQLGDFIAPFIEGVNEVYVGFSCFDYIKENISKNIKVVDGEDLTFDLRAIKDKKEIEALKKVAEFTDDAVEYILPFIKEGILQRDLEAKLMEYALSKGLSNYSFDPTCGFSKLNSYAAKTLEFTGSEKLVPGTTIALDIGFLIDGYCSDFGRSLHYGVPNKNLDGAYKALMQAQVTMVNKIIPNKTRISELYGFIAEEVKKLGYEDILRFKDTGSLGHQIGIDCHEFPMINNSVDDILRPGMVFCSEPKMWLENEAYLRVEDMILVEEDKAVFLTKFNRDLFELPL